MAEVLIKDLGISQDYQKIWIEMRDFTINRKFSDQDQIWILEHPPVYTLGQAGKSEHILNSNSIPVVNTDRGGQVTYHGPGQIVIYLLINLDKHNISIKDFVCKLEQGCINFLKDYKITSHRIERAPGIYVNNKKICSIGLRVKKGCSYHGIAFNADMDLSPFKDINPCGYKDLEMTQFKDLYKEKNISMEELKTSLLNNILSELKIK